MGHCGFFGTKEKEEDREGKGRKQGAREGGEEKGRKEEKIGERGTGGGVACCEGPRKQPRDLGVRRLHLPSAGEGCGWCSHRWDHVHCQGGATF